jgi:hypothetical protein
MEAISLLTELRQEKEELAATIKVLERRLGSGSPSTSATPSATAKKGHVWSAEQRAAMSRKLRASWKARNSRRKSK